MPKFVNLITFLQKLISKEHLVVIMEFPDWDQVKVIGTRPLAPVQNSVSLKLMQRKTLNFVINLPDVENITK